MDSRISFVVNGSAALRSMRTPLARSAPARLRPAHRDHRLFSGGRQKFSVKPEGIRCRKERARADAGLEDGELRRPLLERAHQRARSRPDRGRAARRAPARETRPRRGPRPARPAGAPAGSRGSRPFSLAGSLDAQRHAQRASRELASARRSTTLRTSARVSWSCAPRLSWSSVVGLELGQQHVGDRLDRSRGAAARRRGCRPSRRSIRRSWIMLRSAPSSSP